MTPHFGLGIQGPSRTVKTVIHQTAVIHPAAKLDPSVRVGPYAVIDGDVVIGPGCEVGPHVYITGQTLIGAQNRFHSGCVIGDAPQDLKYAGALTSVRIGDRNIFREHVSVHRSTTPEGCTVVGSDNFLMVNAHIGHNSLIGNHVIIANGSLLGGHVVIEDRAFLSGNCMIHQFVRIGTLSLMQGGAGVSKDVPPYTLAKGVNTLCGLNTVGLRRAGLGSNDRLLLRKLYHQLFRSGETFSSALAKVRENQEFSHPLSSALIAFVSSSHRGVCQEKQPRGTRADLEPSPLRD